MFTTQRNNPRVSIHLSVLHLRMIGLVVFFILTLLTGCATRTLLVTERTQVTRYPIGSKNGPVVFIPPGKVGSIHKVQIVKQHVFALTTQFLVIMDLQGQIQEQISLPAEAGHIIDFAVLPAGDFALFDNRRDHVYFIDSTGIVKTSVPLPEADEQLQGMCGIVVGNRLVFTGGDIRRILQIDLDTYEISVFKDLSYLPMPSSGRLAYSERVYYLCLLKKVYSFRSADDTPKLVAELPEGYIMEMKIAGNIAFLAVNGMIGSEDRIGSVYELNLKSGAYEKIVMNLERPSDLELIDS